MFESACRLLKWTVGLVVSWSRHVVCFGPCDYHVHQATHSTNGMIFGWMGDFAADVRTTIFMSMDIDRLG